MQGETLSASGAEGCEAVDFTYAELLAEIDRECEHRELIKPGDVPKLELAQRWGISENSALDRMKKLAKKDPRWQVLTVWDPDKAHKMTILRKT